jgi:hypothetical protein
VRLTPPGDDVQPHVVEQRALAETHHHRVEEALALVAGEALEVGSQAGRLSQSPQGARTTN